MNKTNQAFYHLVDQENIRARSFITRPGGGYSPMPAETIRKLRRLIAKGLDYEQMDSTGPGLFFAVLSQISDSAAAAKLFQSMLNNGANPLLSPHKELQYIFSKEHGRKALLNHSAKLEEEGNGWRDPQGANALHVLAYLDPIQLANSLEVTIERMAEHAPEALPLIDGVRAMVSHRMEGGGTPLHLVWNPLTLDRAMKVRKPENQDDFQDHMAWINQHAVVATHCLMKLGGRLLEPNDAGITPMEWLEMRDFNLVEDEVGDLLRGLRVLAETEKLLDDTPAAKAITRPGMRL